MELSTVVNALLLCVFNVAFMVSGIFLNSVVIISLWRSSQLRKKLCYFTILVLSCFDLAVVTLMHPIYMSATFFAFLGNENDMLDVIRFYLAFATNGFSMFALLVLNIERFLHGFSIPVLSSNISYETETYISSGRFDDFMDKSVVNISLDHELKNIGPSIINDNCCSIIVVVHLPKQ